MDSGKRHRESGHHIFSNEALENDSDIGCLIEIERVREERHADLDQFVGKDMLTPSLDCMSAFCQSKAVHLEKRAKCVLACETLKHSGKIGSLTAAHALGLSGSHGLHNQSEVCFEKKLNRKTAGDAKANSKKYELQFDLCSCCNKHSEHSFVMMHASCFLRIVASAHRGSAGADKLGCELCHCEFGSWADMNSHLAGRKHVARLERMELKCDVCNIECNSRKTLEAHFAGKVHASKLRLMQRQPRW